jgi:hypothetical protein
LWGVCGAFFPGFAPQLRNDRARRGIWRRSCDLGVDVSAQSATPREPRTPFDDLDPSAVLTAAEVAERIRVDPRSVRRAAARGDLPASRVCGLRILASDAVAWWRSHARSPAGDDRSVDAAPSKPVARPRRRRDRRPPGRLPLPPRAGGAL